MKWLFSYMFFSFIFSFERSIYLHYLFTQHTHRKFFNVRGKLAVEDSGLFINCLDYKCLQVETNFEKLDSSNYISCDRGKTLFFTNKNYLRFLNVVTKNILFDQVFFATFLGTFRLINLFVKVGTFLLLNLQVLLAISFLCHFN